MLHCPQFRILIIPGDENNEYIDWSTFELEYSDVPPEPVFNSRDNQECKDLINGYYDSSISTHNYQIENDNKLNASYNSILDKQKQYSVNLANNRDFRNFIQSDWNESWIA